MKNIHQITPGINGIFTRDIVIEEPFIDVAQRFSRQPGTVLLLSGGDLDCARYHILGIQPWLTLKSYGNRISISTRQSTRVFDANPFDTLRSLLCRYQQHFKHADIPVVSGLLGYLAYDLKDHLEILPKTSIDDLELPQMLFYAPSILLVHDKKQNQTVFSAPELTDTDIAEPEERLRYLKHILESPAEADNDFHGDFAGFRSNFSKTEYESAISRIRDYIAAGDVYQVNMSQRFEMHFSGSAFSLFSALFNLNPAPFFAYIHAGDHEIVSTSPERFILQQGTQVETRPIKGTRPRGNDQKQDNAFKQMLLESRKDDAELSMIVDLLRNDIGRVCKGGSVYVAGHKKIEAYENVYHLVSVIKGELAPDKDTVDLIAATFPGGSITGCPKIRTMEIIDELEPVRRHIYTGSIGYISFHNTMDLSIAIRTATIVNHKIYFSAGGGVVYDSDPSDEYEETLHKGRSMFTVFKDRDPLPEKEPLVWINGALKPRYRATLNVAEPGVQYGYGFFETIRVNHGAPGYLGDHLHRFNHTWRILFPDTPPDLSWDAVIDQVIRANHLENQIAAVKIMAFHGSAEIPPCRHTLAVTARPYVHRLEALNKNGLDLAIYPEPRQTPLADHKTLNYLYYLQAGKWAKEQGMDEAFILNPDGSLSETNTANILLIKGHRIIQPVSRFVLNGVMANKVTALLSNQGYTSFEKTLYPEELFDADQVLLTNSLMGVVPIRSVNGNPVPPSSNLWKKINEIVL